ncbi:large ribosomal subunit protein mL55 isoform X2 [Columba livia]|uniref:large ribosomal subunit protein mL55 isoform X2 n=1 Tax=Columba livia TaxID=8932 RepID=UPI0031BA9FA0
MASRSRRQIMAGEGGCGGIDPGSPRAPAAATRPDVTRRRRSRERRAAGRTTSGGGGGRTGVRGGSVFAWTGMAAVSRALSALRLDTVPKLLPPIVTPVRGNSNRAAISHLHRQRYGRLYPVLLVKTNGSTVRLRYKEPKRILMLPLDSNTLPEEERRARLRRHFPSKPKAEPEETFEGIDLDTYKKFWKK